MTKIYENLREKLDLYSVGFPLTKSGVELKLLQRLFTEEDARLFLDLTLSLETSESIATRTGRDVEDITGHLERLAKKGLIYKQTPEAETMYGAYPFVAGWYEYPLFEADKEMARLVEEYFEEGFLSDDAAHTILPIKTEPSKEGQENTLRITSYPEAINIINSNETIALADCVCRSHKKILEEGCDGPVETCLVFDAHAQFYVDNNKGRIINREEALEILEKCEYAGMIHQTGNSINPGGMCNCCGDCCRILRMLAKHETPAKMVLNRYAVKLDRFDCIDCQTCAEQCQMEAIKPGPDNLAIIDRERCIGCGLCAFFCPAKACTMELKPEYQNTIPESFGTTIGDEAETNPAMNQFHASFFGKG